MINFSFFVVAVLWDGLFVDCDLRFGVNTLNFGFQFTFFSPGS
jgi:hypothetical protein